MNPTISIIVPVYGVEKYINRCIDSVLRQTYANLEVILVDDGSPDRCPQICDEYAALGDRVKVIHKENGGLGYARNSGLEICTGAYIMFVDSDDYICDGAVQVLYERLVADDSDMAVGKHTDVYDNGATNDAYCAFMKDAVLTRNDVFQGMGKYAVSAWGKLYKREMLESIRYPALKCAEDLWVFPAILDQCTRISVVNQTVYYYFQNAESITQKKSEQAKCDELEAILRITELLWHRGFCESAKRYYAKAISKALLFARKAEARARFQKHFDRQKRKDLLKGQTFKTQAKWLLLYFPVIYTVIRYVKRTVGRD